MINIVSFIFCSSIFWMTNTVDLTAWSLIEAITILLLLTHLYSKKDLKLPERNILLPLLLLLLGAALSLSWSSHFHATLMSFYKLLFIYLTLILFMNHKESWEKALSRSAILMTGIGTFLTLFFPKLLDLFQMRHPSLFYGFLAQGGILSLGAFYKTEKSNSYFYLFLSILTGCALILSKSLAPFLGWSVGILWVTYFYSRKKIKFVLLFLLGLTLLSLIDRPSNPFHKIWERKQEDSFTLERLQIWKDSARYFFQHPIQGTGWGTFRDHYPEYKSIEGLRVAPYAHNLPLQILCELGVLGFAIFFWLGIKFFQSSKNFKGSVGSEGLWISIALGTLFQSLFDFNLHFPSIIILTLFCLALILPSREINFESKPYLRWGTFLILIPLMILVLLPGIAELTFKWNYTHPLKRIVAAQMATKLDPFNALYKMETGRKRDLFLAIELEPRNVWFRRICAQVYFEEWKSAKRDESLQKALEQYKIILQLAPNVKMFREEAENLILLSQNKNQ